MILLKEWVARYDRNGIREWCIEAPLAGWLFLTDQRLTIVGYGLAAFAIIAQHYEGDVNGDGTVDDEDLTLIIERYGASGPAADVNSDGIVYKEDLEIAATYFGLGFDQNEGRGEGMGTR